MAKLKEPKADQSKEELLNLAQEAEDKAYQKDRAAFIVEYNKLCEKFDLQIAAVPKTVAAGNGLFGIGMDYVIERRPKVAAPNGK